MKLKNIERLSLYSVFVLAIGYFILITILCQMMYDCFFYDADLAWSSHLLAWNSEKWPMYNVMNQTWLGDHFDPIGIILLPFFTLFPSAWVLLIFQNLVFASIPILSFFLARQVLQSAGVAFLIALISVLNPAIWYINLYNFHWVTLTIPLTLGYFLALAHRKSGISLACLALMMLCKEHVALLVIPLSIAHYLCFKQLRTLIGVVVCALLLFISVNIWLFPALGIRAPIFRWTYLGENVQQIIWGMLSNPQLGVEHLFIKDNAHYLLDLLIPWGFLSLLNWRFLLPGVIFITFGLSTDPLLRNIQYQNASMLLSCIAVSAIYGVRWIWQVADQKKLPKIAKLLVVIFLLGVGSYNFFYRSPNREGSKYYQHQLTHHGLRLRWKNVNICPKAPFYQALLDKIPEDPNVSVVAFRPIAYRLVSHPRLHLFDRDHLYKDNYYLDFDYIIGNGFYGWYRSGKEYTAFLKALVNHPQWKTIYVDKQNNFILKNVSSPLSPLSQTKRN